MKRNATLLAIAAVIIQIAAPAFSQNPTDDVADIGVYFNSAVRRPAAKADHLSRLKGDGDTLSSR